MFLKIRNETLDNCDDSATFTDDNWIREFKYDSTTIRSAADTQYIM